MIQELEKQFIGTGEVKEFCFTQIKQGDRAYIYKVEVSDDFSHYEVFERRSNRMCIDFENRIYSDTDKKEFYPKARDFGLWAFTYRTLPSALKRFDFLEE